MSEPGRITLDTAAKRAGMSRQKLDFYISQGAIESHHATGYCQYVYADELEAFIERRERTLHRLASPATARAI